MNTRIRAYSGYNREAAALLGRLIALRRKELRMTARDLADRVGISRTTLRKIENGDMKSEIGLVFEAATIVGIRLFDADTDTLRELGERISDKLALLPKTLHAPKKPVDDDF